MSNRSKKNLQPNDWWTETETPAIARFRDQFDELSPLLQSEMPYTGESWRKHFVRAPEQALWRLKSDYYEKPLALDIAAMAERHFPRIEAAATGSAFGGSGTEGGDIWIPALDGGVFIQLTLVVDDWSHELTGYQHTYIIGSTLFRFLMKELGFEPLSRRLKGEGPLLSTEEVEQLKADQNTPGSKEYEDLTKATLNPPNYWPFAF